MLSLVVAMGKNRCIGKDGQMPWHLPADLKHFKKLTSGHPVVMGRKTFESIGKPLPARTNIVITRNTDYLQEGVLVVGSIKEALKFGQKINDKVFIIGGGEIFKETLSLAEELVITEIDFEPEGDTFFPVVPAEEWEEISKECHAADEQNTYDFCIITYKKRVPLSLEENIHE